MTNKDPLTQRIRTERQRASITPREEKFISEFLKDPSNATAAAIRAGYSKKTAKQIAYQVLQREDIKSILAQHFVDIEQDLSNALKDALLTLHTVMKDEEGKTGDKIRAAKTLLTYAQIAAGVLGLKVLTKKDDEPLVEDVVSPEDLIQRHKDEIERLETILASHNDRYDRSGKTRSTEKETGAGEVH